MSGIEIDKDEKNLGVAVVPVVEDIPGEKDLLSIGDAAHEVGIDLYRRADEVHLDETALKKL